MKKIGLIMAGGKGERLWPMSTTENPKPFIKLIDDVPMILDTYNRLSDIVDKKDIFIITSEDYCNKTKEVIPDFPKENFIVEPEGRDTAAAIGLSNLFIRQKHDEFVLLVCASDHVIMQKDIFKMAVECGFETAIEKKSIVTLGVKPTRPETAYGYIKLDKQTGSKDDVEVYSVDKFVEKPSEEKAIEYLESGEYLWNSGMFIFTSETITRELNSSMPELSNAMKRIEDVIGTDKEKDVLKEEFSKLEKRSIDYGVIEKCKKIFCIKSVFTWDDIGSWGSLFRILPTDNNNNVIRGNVSYCDTKDSLIYSDSETLVGIVGLDNMIVVKEGNSIIICPKDRDQEIKKLLTLLRENEHYSKFL